MARADRLERLDTRRGELEAEYQEVLIAALRKAAAGSWGLFDHNPDKMARAAWKATVTDLCDRGQEIDEMPRRWDWGPLRCTRNSRRRAGRFRPRPRVSRSRRAPGWIG